MKQVLIGVIFVLLFLPTIALAESASLDADLSSDDKAQFDSILEPVLKIYNFIKYIASIVGAIFLLYAGISFMTSGNDPKKRDQSKNIAMYVVIGLLVICADPLLHIHAEIITVTINSSPAPVIIMSYSMITTNS